MRGRLTCCSGGSRAVVTGVWPSSQCSAYQPPKQPKLPLAIVLQVRSKMARFQEAGSSGGSRLAPRQGSAGAAAAADASQPGSPAYFAAAAAGYPAAADAADSIAALRIAAEVPAKLLQGSSAERRSPASASKGITAFPTLDGAVAASLADKEQRLEELQETNQVGQG